MKIVDYKIIQQRVWPFPNQISKGANDFEVTSLFTSCDIYGNGKELIADSVIEEFNSFTFYAGDIRAAEGISQYTMTIATTDNLSIPNVDESYELNVDEVNGIQINANTYIGAVYALMTLQQLIRRKDGKYVIENTPLAIVDEPKVSLRSIMLDCSRHYLPVEVIKKQIRAMGFQKLNHLHLHLTDGQSFPLSLGPYTDTIALGCGSNAISNTGAYSSEEVYTKEVIANLIDYAKQRGVVVIPEIDTPGHSYSWICGYPEIMTCADLDHQTEETCPEPPCGFFNIKEQLPQIEIVMQNVLDEVIAAFKIGQDGYGSYFHIGFDEVGCPNMQTDGCESPSCENTYGDYSVEYANWLLGWFQEYYPNIQIIMWVDQILTSNFTADNQYIEKVKVDPSFVSLQFWNLSATINIQLYELAQRGFSLINSQSNVYYADAGSEGDRVYFGGPLMSQSTEGGSVSIDYQKYWMTIYQGVSGTLHNGWPVSWEEIYLNNFTWLPNDLATSEIGSYQQIPLKQDGSLPGGIIGASFCMWGEQTDETNLEQKLWTKGLAFAESLWRFRKNRPADNILNARFRISFSREDLLRIPIYAPPVVSADLFRNSPWGTLNSPYSSLMYDINQEKQQLPEGYTLQYKRYWSASECQYPVNPFCGPTITDTMDCNGGDVPYVQEGC